MDSPLFHVIPAPSLPYLTHEISVIANDSEENLSPYEIAKAYSTSLTPEILQKQLEDKKFKSVNMRINTVIVSTSTLEYSSVDEAEDTVLDLIPSSQAELTSNAIGTYHSNLPNNTLVSHIRRLGSLIAHRTKRGGGNIILTNEKMFERIHDVFNSMVVLDEPCGRWIHKGIANGAKIYINDVIPSDEVFVAYVGPSKNIIDGPVGVVEHAGSFRMVHRFAANQIISTDFVQRLRFDLAVD